MAGDWIKMRVDLQTSPKVVRMASALKTDRFRVIGGLLSAWSLFDAHSTDGFLSGYSPATLDELIGWPMFSSAMVAVGWLQSDDEGLTLPEFDTHNGAPAKRRAQDADRKRRERSDVKNVQNNSAAKPEAGHKKNVTRVEKSREEENTVKINDNNHYVIAIPTNQYVTVGQVYRVTNDQYREFCELYPGINVAQELRNIKAWNLNNAKSRKTMSGMPKHINSWLARAQNSGGSRGAHQSTNQPGGLPADDTSWLQGDSEGGISARGGSQGGEQDFFPAERDIHGMAAGHENRGDRGGSSSPVADWPDGEPYQ